MRLVKNSQMLKMMVIATAAFPCLFAQEFGWYMGANIGKSRGRLEDAKISNAILGGSIVATSFSHQDRETGYKVFAGYKFNQYLAAETGYFDLGRFGFYAPTVPLGSLRGDTFIRGINLDAVLSMPLTGQFLVFARAGLNHAQGNNNFTGTGAVASSIPEIRHRNTNYKYGGGLEYNFTKHFGARAEIERYRINDGVINRGNVDMLSLGVLYRFERRNNVTPVHVAAYVPPPVAKSYEPLEIPAESTQIVVPVKARNQEYCTILDIQFEINDGGIQREEKEKLGVVGAFMMKYPETTALIEGHTDNVGTSQHNMELSKQRAESVVSYLVDNIHIDPSRLSAVGYGDSRPVADNSTEEGKRANRRIGAVIACATDVEGLPVVPARMTMAMLIEFDSNSADVNRKYHNDLRKVADFLKANLSVTATVEGHTGNLQGTPAAAMAISRHRAQSVVNYLVDNFGISASRLTPEGFGQKRRFAYNTSAEGRQENRRVNIIVDYPKK